MHDGGRSGANWRSDVSAFAVTVAIAIRGVGVEEAGGVDNAGDVVGVAVAAVGVGVGVDSERGTDYAGVGGAGVVVETRVLRGATDVRRCIGRCRSREGALADEGKGGAASRRHILCRLEEWWEGCRLNAAWSCRAQGRWLARSHMGKQRWRRRVTRRGWSCRSRGRCCSGRRRCGARC